MGHSPFDLSHEADTTPSASKTTRLRPPSKSGLARGAYYYGLGISLTGILPGINAEYGITFAELGLELKAAAQFVVGRGLSTVVSGAWEGENKGADAEVSLSPMGVQLKLGCGIYHFCFWTLINQRHDRFAYLTHRMELPILVSHDNDTEVAFWTTLVPTTVLALTYHFILRPMEHKRRMEYVTFAPAVLRRCSS